MVWIPQFDKSIYQKRRALLLKEINRTFTQHTKGIVLLCADFELHHAAPFQQESSFYYYTGITEPGVALILSLEGESKLFVPNFGRVRQAWVAGALSAETNDPQQLGVSSIENMGSPIAGYHSYPFFEAVHYQSLIHYLQESINKNIPIFTLAPATPGCYFQQRWILDRLRTWIPQLSELLIDINLIVAEMRRTKTSPELSLLRQAIAITIQAHEETAALMRPDILESDVEAEIEYTYIKNGARRAFPSIVASGRNGAVLHYNENNALIKNRDLVVVDIGARYGYYCADITRTYPANGSFTARQLELYTIVLETQQYIEQLAKPGIWLSHRDYPDRSLNHLAKSFIADRGYGDYFMHGIGHFLGLDVHDVGDYTHPLRSGDVITIEPGIYIAQEEIGIRIEDNYLITDSGAQCLSAELPKTAEEIENLVRNK